MNGVLLVSIKTDGSNIYPLLENGETNTSFQFHHGIPKVESLLVQAGTKGLNEREYILVFEVRPSNEDEAPVIEPFELSFLFYDG